MTEEISGRLTPKEELEYCLWQAGVSLDDALDLARKIKKNGSIKTA